MSTALIATMPMPLRPNAIVLRYMCCQRNSVSHGSSPISSGFEVQVDQLFGHTRRERGIADADQSVVREDFDDQPAVEA